MSLENRVDCPNCFGEGKILTAVHPKTSDRIYMCDKCRDIWEERNFDTAKCYSYDTFWLKTNRSEEDYISWEYIIK